MPENGRGGKAKSRTGPAERSRFCGKMTGRRSDGGAVGAAFAARWYEVLVTPTAARIRNDGQRPIQAPHDDCRRPREGGREAQARQRLRARQRGEERQDVHALREAARLGREER